ncbi:shikimate kinase [Psychroserpens burtonensis]|uniref:Shikimate kinase n=1 Tax=Psychroserpens burtonensis TaxID=49278 RepID=A0A5C7B9Z9_9FLAO|nr:shikimate kinase [Psychroserpens burtonensis]TXE16871.1 shikimate kinase [Psychroserpens burtonensis]
MTLFLVGYMGSGKSVIGSKLADILKYNYLDLDGYIEEKEGATIKIIFKTKGEIYFRKLESSYLKELIGLNNTVISLGGGTPCYGNNLNLILESKNSLSIYLKASIKTLVGRLYQERYKRPLIAHLEDISALNEFIGKHIFERAPFYEQSSLSIKTDGLDINEVVDNLVLKLF